MGRWKFLCLSLTYLNRLLTQFLTRRSQDVGLPNRGTLMEVNNVGRDQTLSNQRKLINDKINFQLRWSENGFPINGGDQPLPSEQNEIYLLCIWRWKTCITSAFKNKRSRMLQNLKVGLKCKPGKKTTIISTIKSMVNLIIILIALEN